MTTTFYMVVIGIICFSIGFIAGIATVMKVLGVGLFIGSGGGYDDDDIVR